MRIEKLSKGKNKKIILSIVILLFIIGIIYITNSKAKYQVSKNVQIVNGNVNYSLADLNVLALQVQNAKGSETYNPIETVPSGNYEVNTEKSYFTIPGDSAQHKDIPMKYENGKVSISINKKGTKCYIYLDFYMPASEKTLTNLGRTSQALTASFTSPDTSEHLDNGKSIMYSNTDDLGTTYYFRGKVKDNWVKFGKDKNQQDMYWRIIRINGNGSIRMIYTGSGSPITNDGGYTSQGDQTNITNDGTSVASYTYNNSWDRAEYVGFKYTLNSQRGTTDKSNALTQLETWFGNNMSGEISQLDREAGFCNDRTAYSDTAGNQTALGYGKSSLNFFGAYKRNRPNGNAPSSTNPAKPVFTCPTTGVNGDLFTVSGSSKGNGQLTYPVGLITADEVTFAGGLYNTKNDKYYLYTHKDYWTMSPSDYSYSTAEGFKVYLDGFLLSDSVYGTYGVRPVINLKVGTAFKAGGTGEYNNPYEVS